MNILEMVVEIRVPARQGKSIEEFDTAIASFEHLNKWIAAYLRAQAAIEARLRSAFRVNSQFA